MIQRQKEGAEGVGLRKKDRSIREKNTCKLVEEKEVRTPSRPTLQSAKPATPKSESVREEENGGERRTSGERTPKNLGLKSEVLQRV